MHKHPKLIFIVSVLAFLLLAFSVSTPTFAVDNIVETTFFGNLEDNGGGCGVYTILNTVVDILSIGVGILAIISITVVGIKYLTAKGNIDQAERAKHRMFQIVVGIIAYILIYASIQWLLPGGKLNFSQQCATISDEEFARLKETERKEREERTKQLQKENSPTPSIKTKTSNNDCMKKAAKVVRNKICKLKTPGERISATAKLLVGSGSAASEKYKQAMEETGANDPNDYCQTIGESCNTFVATVILASGVDPNVPKGRDGNNTRDLYDYFSNSSKWKAVSNDPSDSREGDVVIKPLPSGHVTVTVKNSNGNLVTAHASYCGFFPILGNSVWTDYDGTPTAFRYKGK
jgi:hypothetical protein